MSPTSLPQVMENAREDLLATVEGRFSPEDWQKILQTAEARFRQKLATEAGITELDAWKAVIRDFHQHSFWGYSANYRPPKSKSMGLQLIWITFNSFCTIKVLILWFGQIYSRSDDPKDKWIFFTILTLALGNIAYFLWRNRAYED